MVARLVRTDHARLGFADFARFVGFAGFARLEGFGFAVFDVEAFDFAVPALFADVGAAAAATGARPVFRAAARSMIFASISPASPPLAGRFDTHTSGRSAARMSSKSPPLFTLFGANSTMSTSPAQSSLCLISSQERSPLPPGYRPPVRTTTHEPFSL